MGRGHPPHPGPESGRARAADTLAALLGGRRATLLRTIGATDGITTRRAGASVRHRATPLGLSLLRAQPRVAV